jgi:hypothetical protein
MSPDPSRHVPLRQPTAFHVPVCLPPLPAANRKTCLLARPAMSLCARQHHSRDQAVSLPARSYSCNPSRGGGGAGRPPESPPQPPPPPPPRSSGNSVAIWQIFWLHNSKRAKTYSHSLANFVQKGQKWGRASEKLGFLLLLFLILCTSKKY